LIAERNGLNSATETAPAEQVPANTNLHLSSRLRKEDIGSDFNIHGYSVRKNAIPRDGANDWCEIAFTHIGIAFYTRIGARFVMNVNAS
jgi:hypothetical protein